MPILAPWLRPADEAGEWLRGLALGQAVAEANARLEEAQNRTALEAQIQSQNLKQRSLEDQQRIQITKAYHDAEIGLKRDQLRETAAVNDFKTRQAATKLMQNMAFNQRLKANGGDVMDALFYSNTATPANVLTAKKVSSDLGDQRLKLSQERLAMQKEQQAEREREFNMRQTNRVPQRIGQRTVTDPTDPNARVTTYMFAPPAGAAGAALGGSSPANPANEVRRQTKDGKTAVFDADTKKFLRYDQ